MPSAFSDPYVRSPASFFSMYTSTESLAYGSYSMKDERFRMAPPLRLDNIPYHNIDTQDIPKGIAEVEVVVDDNGVEFKATMIAGQVGWHVCSSGDTSLSAGGEQDTVRPAVGWCMLENEAEGSKNEAE